MQIRTRFCNSLPNEQSLYILLPASRSEMNLDIYKLTLLPFWWTLIYSLWWSHQRKCVVSFFPQQIHASWRHFLWLRIQLIRKHPKFQAFTVKCLVQCLWANEGQSQNWKWKVSEGLLEDNGWWQFVLTDFWLHKVQMDVPYCQIDWSKHHC